MAYHRHPHTAQEMRSMPVGDDAIPVRGKRRPHQLPDSRCDIRKGSQRSWKRHRKTQYKVD